MTLKPCPFCGSEALLSERLNYVTCGNELCVIGNTISIWFLPDQWNTRAPTEETARADAKCFWAQDIDGYWETSCGEAHIFEEGTPSQNSHDFCPYCGKHLEEQTP